MKMPFTFHNSRNGWGRAGSADQSAGNTPRCAELPHIKIVMLTTSEEDEDLFEAIKSGASGYLLKSLNGEELFEMLSDLAKGEAPFSPGLAAGLLREFTRQADDTGAETKTAGGDVKKGLTPRRIEVLTLVARGLTYKEVGDALGLSERTIKYHMEKIVEQLHLENRA